MTVDRKRRVASPDALLNKRVKVIVAPFQHRIGPWQEQLAHLRSARILRALSNRDRGHAAELLPLVISARIELDAVLAQLGEEAVTQHSLVTAVRSSLMRLCEELEDLAGSALGR